MLSHSPLAGATELHARKLQATNVLATLARIRGTGVRGPGDIAALDQGRDLMDSLVKGQQLFSNATVTRQLVGEGFAFLAAARALQIEEKDRLGECVVLLNDMLSALSAIKNDGPVDPDKQTQLETFLSEFARVLQSDINAGRARRHTIPNRL